MSNNDFLKQYSEYLEKFNNYLDENINELKASSATYGEKLMLDAMEYSLAAGGKRLRPVLTLAFCECCGGDCKNALPFALAIEIVHTYSLIHDDLPCMDNDDLRRGKPSNHIKFGYANALLAGDSLLTLAFELLMKKSTDYQLTVNCAYELAKSAGYSGMIAGQVEDLANENKVDVSYNEILSAELLKTSKLIEAACVMGCLCANADSFVLTEARNFAENFGIAFQLRDDLLDIISTTEKLGKPVGSDAEQNKNTFITLLGKDGVCHEIEKLKNKLLSSAETVGDYNNFLKNLVENTFDWRLF